MCGGYILIIFSSLLQHGVIIQSVIKERGAQNHVLSLFDTFSSISSQTSLEGTDLRSKQKEKEWSGWDLNSKFSLTSALEIEI
jgi:hypothetical protein